MGYAIKTHSRGFLILIFSALPGVCLFVMHTTPGEITPSYVLHTRAFGTYLLGGLFTLQKGL
jgi:hypothetical protein